MLKDTWKLSANELFYSYVKGDLTPTQVITDLVERIYTVNSKINAFICYDADLAMKNAIESESRYKNKAFLSPLDGVPVSIKDLILTKDMATLRGSKSIENIDIVFEDAPVVSKLKGAGAIIIGKTSSPEFGHKGTTQSDRHGITLNPWNISKNAGGSSGGSAAAVSAGLGPMSIGTDGGGSVRIPCSFSGLFGLKPTFGRIPAYPLSPFGTVANLGPITRTVKDAAMMMNIIAKPDVKDWFSIPINCNDYLDYISKDIKGIRLGYTFDWGMSKYLGSNNLDSEVIEAVEDTIESLKAYGIIIEKIDINWPNEPYPIFKAIWESGAANLYRKLRDDQKENVEFTFLDFSNRGKDYTLFDLMDIEAARAENSSYFSKILEKKYTAIIGPTMPIVAFDAHRNVPNGWPEKDIFSWTPYTFPFNLTKHPASTVNCAFSKLGLPIGMQVVSPLFREDICMGVSYIIEKVSDLLSIWPEDL